jgi:hypothetical protein
MTSKLQKKQSALKREHPAFQNMKYIIFFLLLWVIFALQYPDPDSEYRSGSTDLIESGSNPDTDPDRKLCRISEFYWEVIYV